MPGRTKLAKLLPLLLGLLLAAWVVGWVSRMMRTSATAAPEPLPIAEGQPAREQAYKLIAGPYEVDEVAQITLRDAKRRKELPVRILYPTGNGPFPVIIFSHGAGGSMDCCTDLAEHWTGYGYVILQPTHADSIKLRRQQGEQIDARPGMSGGIGSALREPGAWANRARDISFLIDSLDELERRVPALQGKMDAKRIGVGGHSLGAYTAQLIGGATVDTPEGKAVSYADERVRAILVISGQGRDQQGLTEHSWDHITRPMMTMTGSRDRGAGGQGPEWKKEPFDLSPAGDKYHVFLEGANHFSFLGRPAGGAAFAAFGREPEDAGEQEAVFSYVQVVTMAFWDAYLKADAKAKAYLDSDALAHYSAGAAKLSRR